MTASLFSFENVYRAWLDCRRRKRSKPSAMAFEAHAEEEIFALARELAARSYRPRPSFCFVAKNDKHREVFAAQFRDRVVHHLLVRELEKIWEPVFIHDSYACRRGKGTHAAVFRLQSFMRKATANSTRRAWFLQLDIRSFFPSIDRRLLLDIVLSRIRCEEIRWLAEAVILHDPARDAVFTCPKSKWRHVPPGRSLFTVPPGKGLPIGNLTSQFFANVYLNPLDQFAKHTLKARWYVRYVDDMVIVHEEAKVLAGYRDQIEEFLKKALGLNLHPFRRRILPVTNGADFLGYMVRPSHLLVRIRTVDRCREVLEKHYRQMARLTDKTEALVFPPKQYVRLNAALQSYLGIFRHAATIRKVEALFNAHPWLRFLFLRREHTAIMRLKPAGRPRSLRSQYGFFRRRFHGLILFQVGKYWELYDRDALWAVRNMRLAKIPARRGHYARCGVHAACVGRLTINLTEMRRSVLIVSQNGNERGRLRDRQAIAAITAR